MIKQNKGKDLHKIKRLPKGPFYVSTKYDGHYIQIVYDGKNAVFTTSGGKEFYLSDMAAYIQQHFTNPFHIECEFNYGCKGLLGDRAKSAIITTYRTQFNKGIVVKGNRNYDTFRVLDLLDRPEDDFTQRLKTIKILFRGHDWFYVPNHVKVHTLEEATAISLINKKLGFEGAMAKAITHIYQPGKRTNDIVKLKPRLTADLLCIGIKEGEGKYEGLIGSLLLRDSLGVYVHAGSGLSDEQRQLPHNSFIGQVIEIEYEHLQDTYIQPIIKHIRYDKTKKDIT